MTRPKIAYVVHIVSQFMTAPQTIHFTAVLHILRYVDGTLGHGLQFSSQSSRQATLTLTGLMIPLIDDPLQVTISKYHALADVTSKL